MQPKLPNNDNQDARVVETEEEAQAEVDIQGAVESQLEPAAQVTEEERRTGGFLPAAALEVVGSIGPVCDRGIELKVMCEGPFDTVLMNGSLTAGLVEAGVIVARSRGRGHGNKGRAERTRYRIVRYAMTQELFKTNASRLVELVLTDNLRKMDVERVVHEPPREEIVQLYEHLWGARRECTLVTTNGQEQPDADFAAITAEEVKAQNRKLKPGGAAGPESHEARSERVPWSR